MGYLPPDMDPAPRALVFVRLGFAFVAVGVLASVFVIATLQAAYSPLALALPSAPFDQLANESFRFAGGSFLFVALVAALRIDSELRGLARLFSAGAFGKLALLAFAAANGMMAIQATDPRALAPRLFALRMLTNALVLASLVWAGWILTRGARTRGSSE